MLKRATTVVGALVVAAATVPITLVLGIRKRSPWFLDGLRRMSRDALNPRVMETAGQPGAYASIIHHRGRKTGAAYETPVQLVPTDDGFLISLTYGTRADWTKNVLAAGTAAIVTEGETYEVDRPEVVAVDEAGASFPLMDRWTQRLIGVNQCLLLHRATSTSTDH